MTKNRTLILAAAATLATSAAVPVLAGAPVSWGAEEDPIGASPSSFSDVSRQAPAEGADVKAKADASAAVSNGARNKSGETGGPERADAVGVAIGLQGSEKAGAQ